MRDPERTWNPYAGGILLGLVLLAAFVVMGQGLGAASASWRLGVAGLDAVAPDHVARTPALAAATSRGNPLDDWVVFEVGGVLMGAAARMARGCTSGQALSGGALTSSSAASSRRCSGR